jgi:hypothetical protein
MKIPEIRPQTTKLVNSPILPHPNPRKKPFAFGAKPIGDGEKTRETRSERIAPGTHANP